MSVSWLELSWRWVSPLPGVVLVVRPSSLATLTLLLIAGVLLATAEDPLTVAVAFIIGARSLWSGFRVFDFYFQSRVLSRYPVMASFCALSCSALVRIVLIFSDCSVLWFAGAFLFEGAVLAALLFVLFRRKSGAGIRLRFDGALARSA